MWRPRFLREIREQIETVGFTQATYELLARDKVSIRTEGDIDRLREHQGGMLFVGDHQHQWEFVALAGLLHTLGRDDMRNIAKFYVKHQITSALGEVAAQNIIPVYPRLLARDRNGDYGNERFSRWRYKRWLLSNAESAIANEAAIQDATDHLARDGVVNIYPCGGIVDARKHPWRQGMGRIITKLPEETRKEVLVAPYRMVDASWLRLVAAVALRGHEPFVRPQAINLEIGPLQTAADLVEGLPPESQEDPMAITAQLRDEFLERFADGELH